MLNSIKITTQSGLTQEFVLRRPDSSGLLIRSVSGLGPGAVDLKMTEYASLPGSVYSGSRKPTRNIVLDTVIMWHNTVEQARRLVERWFKIGEEILIIFYTDTRTCYTKGVIESNEPTIFDDGSVDGIPCQISIICPDPRLFDVDDTILVTYSSLQSGFNFPAIISNARPVGILESENRFNIVYDGTENEGVIFTFVFKQAASSLKIIDYNTGKYMLISGPETIFQPGDKLTITTKVGEKSILLVRNNITYNYLNYYKLYESDWVSLKQGSNAFVIETNGVQSATAYNIRVAFTKAYWGI